MLLEEALHVRADANDQIRTVGQDMAKPEINLRSGPLQIRELLDARDHCRLCYTDATAI